MASNPSFVYRGVTAFLHHVKEKSRLEDPGAPSDSGSLGAWAVWGFLAADLFLQHLLFVRLIPEAGSRGWPRGPVVRGYCCKQEVFNGFHVLVVGRGKAENVTTWPILCSGGKLELP